MPNKRYTLEDKIYIYHIYRREQKPGKSVIFVTLFQVHVILIRLNNITFFTGDTLDLCHANSSLKNNHTLVLFVTIALLVY